MIVFSPIGKCSKMVVSLILLQLIQSRTRTSSKYLFNNSRYVKTLLILTVSLLAVKLGDFGN